MLHVDAIGDALAHNDLGVVRAAFRALVDLPQAETVEGAGTVEVLCSLLARVSRALQHDQSAMPAGLSASVAVVLSSPMDAAATYATGARIVLDHQYHWRGRYLQHALSGGKL